MTLTVLLLVTVEGFICLENEAESCGLKQKTLNRFPLEDLDGANSVEECQDVCEAAVRKRRKTKKQTEQCNCLCNYYSVCLRGMLIVAKYEACND